MFLPGANDDSRLRNNRKRSMQRGRMVLRKDARLARDGRGSGIAILLRVFVVVCWPVSNADVLAGDGLADTSATLNRRIKADPTGLNPILMFTGIDAEFEYLLWDPPIVLDKNLAWTLNPAIVERYEESADHLEARLVLKPGLKWRDGAPYTAEEVAYSWGRIVDDRVVCRRFGTSAAQLVGCEALDARTVRYRFKEPLPTNKLHIGFPVLPKHIYASVADEDPSLALGQRSAFCNRHPVGNGPYRLIEWQSGQRLVLERWEDYPGDKPAFRRVVFNVIPDGQAALSAFESGAIDETALTPQQFVRETNGEAFTRLGVKRRAEQWTTYYIGWNVGGTAPFLADAKVRRALCHALNTPLIVDRVFHGLFTPSKGLFPLGVGVRPPAEAPYGFDLKRAAALLNDAGWYRDDADGWRYKTIDGKRVAAGFVMHLVHGSQTSPLVADLYQDDLRKLGVRMTTRVLEWAVFNERNFKHEFQAYLSAWTPSPDPGEAWNLFHSQARTNGRNYVGYVNAEVDALFASARHEFDSQRRLAIFSRIGEIIYADAPYTFLVNANSLWALNKRLLGVEFSPRGPTQFYPGLRNWWTPALAE